MKLIELLGERVSSANYDEALLSWLKNTINEIVRDASAHLAYVQNVLTEFDRHDANHSSAVLDVIEKLLGNKAKELSSYDLFFLVAISYLHDCGMAVSDFEINVMKLVENDEYDGKRVCSNEQALSLIQKKRDEILESENDKKDVKQWMFYPGSEEKLFDYYSQLLIDYQSFRNGKIDVISKSKDIEKTNKKLRTDYIRSTHANRVETYIKYWGETRFADFLGNKAMGKRLANDLATVCRAHGEDVEFIRELKKNKRVMYLRNETSNLQFVAMMLRIGDIVHFSYDRAPVAQRSLRHFESDYSYDQWRIKADSGINYSISEDGEISYSAFCCIPQDYYDLMKYVDFIDNEIYLYNRLRHEEKWDSCYPELAKRIVNRDNISHDDSFDPVPDLKFSLEQHRILELLMGAQLYSDEYACLRELYQNALDACRCQMAIDSFNGKESKGRIEFGIEYDGENRYVYCLDNGKGMSRHIIENYLLRIGSSYYRSSDFYQSQAATGNTFTPTSQFGIGILSCFMIGDRLEITTREEGGELISCAMESIHECFYYKKEPSKSDKDRISSYGTLIKIFLNEHYKNRVLDDYHENLGYLLWKTNDTGRDTAKDEENRFSDHLFFILEDFIGLVPEGIDLIVRLEKGKSVRVSDKPIRMGEGFFEIPKEEKASFSKGLDDFAYYELDVENEGIQCRKLLFLPTKENSMSVNRGYDTLILGNQLFCVDGIKVDSDGFVEGSFLKAINKHDSSFLINFRGSDRPQLSINRESIVNYDPLKFDGRIGGMLKKLLRLAIDKTISHFNRYDIQSGSDLYLNVWWHFFGQFYTMPGFLVAQLFMEKSISALPMPFPKGFTSSKMTFGGFMEDKVCFENYHFPLRFAKRSMFSSRDALFQKLILHKVLSSKSIIKDKKTVSLEEYNSVEIFNCFEKVVPSNFGLFDNFDYVSHLYPFVSRHIAKAEFDESLIVSLLGALNSLILNAVFSYGNVVRNKDEKDIENENREEISNSISTNLAAFLQKNRQFIRFPYYFIDDPSKFSGRALLFYSSFSKRLFDEDGKRFSNCEIEESCKEELPDIRLSIIVFFLRAEEEISRDDFYYFVLPGLRTRQELVDAIPEKEWEPLSEKEYHFFDDTLVKRSQKEHS